MTPHDEHRRVGPVIYDVPNEHREQHARDTRSRSTRCEHGADVLLGNSRMDGVDVFTIQPLECEAMTLIDAMAIALRLPSRRRHADGHHERAGQQDGFRARSTDHPA